MSKIIALISEHYQWIFSGIGGVVISLFITIMIKKKSSSNNVKQTNIIAGGDVTGRDKNYR